MEEIAELKGRLEQENCVQLSEFDAALVEKEEDIFRLEKLLAQGDGKAKTDT